MISEEFAIAQTAVKIISSVNFEQEVYIHNEQGFTVYLGASNVNSTNGYHLTFRANMSVKIPQDNELYAIADSGSGNIHILRPD